MTGRDPLYAVCAVGLVVLFAALTFALAGQAVVFASPGFAVQALMSAGVLGVVLVLVRRAPANGS